MNSQPPEWGTGRPFLIPGVFTGAVGEGEGASHLRTEGPDLYWASLGEETALVLVQYYDTKTERLKKFMTSFFLLLSLTLCLAADKG